MSKNLSNRLLKPDSIFFSFVAVLYECKLPLDWKEFLQDSGLSGVVSPLHMADDDDKKAHRHLYIKPTKHRLDYFEVMDFLGYLQDYSPLTPIIASVGVDNTRRICRYFVHLEQSEKEQFDITDPLSDEFKIDDNGISEISGLPSIYSDSIGFFQFGEFDFPKYLRYTAREKNPVVRSQKEMELYVERLEILKYIRDERVVDYDKVVEFAMDRGYKCIWNSADSSLFYRYCSCMLRRSMCSGDDKKGDWRNSKHRDTLKIIISKLYSLIPDDIVDWIIDYCPDLYSNGIVSDKYVRRTVCQLIDINTYEVRPKYEEVFNNYCIAKKLA